MFKKKALLSLTIFICALSFISCSAEIPQDAELSKQGFRSTTADLITDLSQKESLNAAEHFMLATSYNEKKQYKKALFHYASSCFQNYRPKSLRLFAQPIYKHVNSLHLKSAYYQDAVLAIAEIFTKYNEYQATLKFLSLVDDQSLQIQKNLLAAKSYSHLQKKEKAIKLLQEAIEQEEEINTINLYRLKLESLIKDLPLNQRFHYYSAIVDSQVKSWKRDLAAQELAKNPEVPLDDQTIINCCQTLLDNNQAKLAADIFAKLKNKNEETNLLQLKVLLANKKLKQARRFAQQHQISREQFTFTQANLYWQQDQKFKSVRLYQKLLNSPTKKIKEQALRRTAFYYEDHGSSLYLKYMKQYVASFPQEKYCDLAYWQITKKYIRSKNFSAALKNINESLTNLPQGEYSDRQRYWAYQINLQQKKNKKAQLLARDLVVYNAGSFYTWRLLNQLADPNFTKEHQEFFKQSLADGQIKNARFYHALLTLEEQDLSARQKRAKEIEDAGFTAYQQLADFIKKTPHSAYSRALERYLAIGYSTGIKHLHNHWPVNQQKEFYAIQMKAAQKYENSYLALISLRQLLQEFNLKEDLFLLDQNLVEVILPLPYQEDILEAAIQYQLQPAMLYAVIKAESNFNHLAESSVGAQGLMQLMPATAKDLARQLGFKEFALKDPQTSILFGAKYLSWLADHCQNNFTDMVASYNAGLGNSRKWRQKLNDDNEDIYIERIPFDETRFYVLRTNKYLQQYQLFYQQELKIEEQENNAD